MLPSPLRLAPTSSICSLPPCDWLPHQAYALFPPAIGSRRGSPRADELGRLNKRAAMSIRRAAMLIIIIRAAMLIIIVRGGGGGPGEGDVRGEGECPPEGAKGGAGGHRTHQRGPLIGRDPRQAAGGGGGGGGGDRRAARAAAGEPITGDGPSIRTLSLA
eukprot:1192312-Prorocentrum_minimum.AAC.3